MRAKASTLLLLGCLGFGIFHLARDQGAFRVHAERVTVLTNASAAPATYDGVDVWRKPDGWFVILEEGTETLLNETHLRLVRVEVTGKAPIEYRF